MKRFSSVLVATVLISTGAVAFAAASTLDDAARPITSGKAASDYLFSPTPIAEIDVGLVKGPDEIVLDTAGMLDLALVDASGGTIHAGRHGPDETIVLKDNEVPSIAMRDRVRFEQAFGIDAALGQLGTR